MIQPLNQNLASYQRDSLNNYVSTNRNKKQVNKNKKILRSKLDLLKNLKKAASSAHSTANVQIIDKLNVNQTHLQNFKNS